MHFGGNYRLQVCKYDEEGGGQGRGLVSNFFQVLPMLKKVTIAISGNSR